jgi:hypothetical protein
MTTRTVHHTHRRSYGNARFTLLAIVVIGLGYYPVISWIFGGA